MHNALIYASGSIYTLYSSYEKIIDLGIVAYDFPTFAQQTLEHGVYTV